ncbi:MAG TPA: response regulator transcription factor, partial [Thermoanaerobaculia bacterium]
MRRRILLVEDDPKTRAMLALYLEREGYEVATAEDGVRALEVAREREPHLVVLDLMLPRLSGLDVCRNLREESNAAIVMVTARSTEEDKLTGLDLGADDYVTKPFSPRELALRVGSVLRRARSTAEAAAAPAPAVLRDGDLEIDVPARRAMRGGVELALTGRELDLLAFLMRHPGQAFGRPELLDKVWGWTFGDHSTVTVHVRRLREKIEDDP